MDFKTSEGAWFDYVPDKPEEGRVQLQILDGEEVRDIVKATETEKVEYKPIRKNGPLQRFEFIAVDEDLATEMRIDKSILDWENTSLNGKPLKCTKANKLKMFYKSPHFRKVYVDGIAKVSQDSAKMYGAEDETGN